RRGAIGRDLVPPLPARARSASALRVRRPREFRIPPDDGVVAVPRYRRLLQGPSGLGRHDEERVRTIMSQHLLLGGRRSEIRVVSKIALKRAGYRVTAAATQRHARIEPDVRLAGDRWVVGETIVCRRVVDLEDLVAMHDRSAQIASSRGVSVFGM